MASQLSKKAALPLAKILATRRNNVSNTGPRTIQKNQPWPKTHVKTLGLRQNGHHFPDDIFRCIFLNENVWISTKNLPKSVPMYPIANIPALVRVMAWRRQGDKPLSEPMMKYGVYFIHSSAIQNSLNCFSGCDPYDSELSIIPYERLLGVLSDIRRKYNKCHDVIIPERVWCNFFEMRSWWRHDPSQMRSSWEYVKRKMPHFAIPSCVSVFVSTIPYTIRHAIGIPVRNVHGANMGPIWGRQGPGGPHGGPANFAIWDAFRIIGFAGENNHQ